MTQQAKSIEKGVVKQRPLTAVAAMEELSMVMAVPVKVKKETIWLRTDIPPSAIKLMKAIGMKIPPKILPQNKKT